MNQYQAYRVRVEYLYTGTDVKTGWELPEGDEPPMFLNFPIVPRVSDKFIYKSAVFQVEDVFLSDLPDDISREELEKCWHQSVAIIQVRHVGWN